MKKIISYSLLITVCFILPMWNAYSKSVCSVYATYKENVPSNTTSIGIKPIEDVKLINIKLQGFWEPLLLEITLQVILIQLMQSFHRYLYFYL